mgnify:CR=1 FL=1
MALNDKQEKFAQAYILHRNATEAAKTAGDVITEIEKQYEFAKANGHTNSAIKALELLSRIRGAKSEKEIDISPEGLDANIVDTLKILGKKKVNELIKKCGF